MEPTVFKCEQSLSSVMNPCLLLSVDSLRADCVTPKNMGQSLEILDSDYARFSNTISHGVATPFAFPGILASTHPVGDGNIPESATTIAEYVPELAIGFSNNGHLREDRGYNRGFDRFVEQPSLPKEGRSNTPVAQIRRVGQRAIERVKQIELLRQSSIARELYRLAFQDPLPYSYTPAPEMVELVQHTLSTSSPGLLWAHWMDPHLPYHPETAINPPENLPGMAELEDIRERIIQADADALSDEEIRITKELYEANVRYYDHHFSRLLIWLRDQSWYDDALIIVVSDHGEYFGEHGQLFHTWDIDPYEEVIRTPLWVKYPEQAHGGDTFDHLVSHGDILATVVDQYEEIEHQPPVHSTPLLEQTDRHVVSVSNTSKRLSEEQGTYVVRRDGSDTTDGEPSEAGKQYLENVPFPECQTTKGDALGVEEAERQRRLRDLGYR